MRRIRLILIQVVPLFALPALVFGQSPPPPVAGTLSFQGLLKDSNGPIASQVSLQFRLFTAEVGGSLVDMDGDGVVEPVVGQDVKEIDAIQPSPQGIVSTSFGPVHPNAFDGTERWLQVTVVNPPNPNFDLPRVRMASSVAIAERLNIPGTGTRAVFVSPSGSVTMGTSTAPGLLSLVNNGGTVAAKLYAYAGGNTPFSYLRLYGSSPQFQTDRVNIEGGDPVSGLGGSVVLTNDSDRNVVNLRALGINGGGQLKLFNGQSTNRETITLDANASGDGEIRARNSAGQQVINLTATGNGIDRYGGLYLASGTGISSANLLGTAGGPGESGGSLALYSGTSPDNPLTFAVNGYDTGGGSKLRMYNGQPTNRQTITLDGNGNAAGGRISLSNSAGESVDSGERRCGGRRPRDSPIRCRRRSSNSRA